MVDGRTKTNAPPKALNIMHWHYGHQKDSIPDDPKLEIQIAEKIKSQDPNSAPSTRK
jgi:hypothetical protein